MKMSFTGSSRPARTQLSFLLIFFVSTFLFSLQAIASDDSRHLHPHAAASLPPELTSAMARDLGWDPAELGAILRTEYRAHGLIADARRALGDHYGGSWIERDQRGHPHVVVATSSMATTRGAARDLQSGRGDIRVELREVRYSLRELEQVVERFNDAAGEPVARSLAGIHSWGIDLPANQVVVVTAPNVSDRALDFFAASDVDLNALSFEVSEHEPSTLVNVVGGFRYNNCSIGFSVRRGWTQGFVTAGHCGTVGTLVRINGVAVGHFQRSDFPGADAAWANVRQSDTLWNLVWVYSNNSTYAVTGSSEAPLGAAVCRSGFRTGWRCGTLTRNNVTVNYGNGPVYGLRESNACAGQGDSGGSWVAGGNQAQGVTSGGALGNDGTNCGIPQNQRRTWFQRLNPMLSAYGLNLVTN